jgi:hypothetical protein
MIGYFEKAGFFKSSYFSINLQTPALFPAWAFEKVSDQ